MGEATRFSDKVLLVLLMGIYSAAELGHFLLGVVSKGLAQDIGYGEKSCYPISNLTLNVSSDFCRSFRNESRCVLEEDCEWNYNGLGPDYQILAGPAYMACFTIAGIAWGVAADKMNRVNLIAGSTILFSLTVSGTAFATQYWHLVLFRMGLAIFGAAISPLAAGIIGDIFPQDTRGLAMGIFNWGIHFGYGSSFAIGTYITYDTFFKETWRLPYFVSGMIGIVIGIVFSFTTSEPRNATKRDSSSTLSTQESRPPSSTNNNGNSKNSENDAEASGEMSEKKSNAFFSMLKRPEVWVLGVAACIRHSAGYSWGYNSYLYFQIYFPHYDSAWWLTGTSIAGGVIGCVVGGYISDLFVQKYGSSNRALVLALSQLVAVPFSFATMYLAPPFAFVTHFLDIVAAEMWFGVVYALIVELSPVHCRSSAVGVALFVINNVGGNLPILVEPLRELLDYKTAIVLLYPGALFTSSILFFVCWLMLRRK